MQIYPILTGTARCKQFQLTGASSKLSRFYQLLFTQKWSAWLPIYCWLIKTEDELILVDTGETADIYQKGYLPAGGLYHKAVQTQITKEEEIPNQLSKIGFKPEDISTIIFTHLHGDHIGGLKYFEHCNIFVSEAEYAFATSKKGNGAGYFPRNWPKWFHPVLIDYKDGEEGVFKKSHVLNDGSIVIVPTPGHSVGHQSVIIKTKESHYFIGGDLTLDNETLEADIPNVILINQHAERSVRKAHEYVKSNQAVFLSSHDWNAPQILREKTKFD